jgi:hypothetical protein
MITASVDGEAASEISYIGIGGSYMLLWRQGILVYTGSLSLTVSISGTSVFGTPVSITSVAGAVVAVYTLPASTTTPTPTSTTTTTPAPATPTLPSVGTITIKLTFTTELTPQQQFFVKSAYWGVLLPVAQVPIENVEMTKDAHLVSYNITLVSYIVTVYVKDAAAAAAVTTRLTDTAALKTAFIETVLVPLPAPLCVCVRARPAAR